MTVRKTQQRDAIRRIFEQAERPLSVAEVLALGQEDVPTLNQATVYRTVNLLEGEGYLVRLMHPEAGTLFERKDTGHHHHFYCRKCELVFDLPGCCVSDQEHVPAGFVTESHELAFRGICRECAGV